MPVCRLCSADENVVDMFHKDLDKAEQLRFYILLATGIHIKEEDKISRMVCHRCCEIAVKLHKYRANAVANDKLLQQEIGQPYVPPITNQHELQRLSLKILSKDGAFSEIAALTDTSNLLQETFNFQYTTEKKPHSDNFVGIKHASINSLLKKYPNITLPSEVYHCDVAPVITLDEDEANEWFKQNLERCQKKLTSANISIRRITSDSKTHIIEQNVSSPDIYEFVSLSPDSVVENPSKKLPLYRPGPKSKKTSLIITSMGHHKPPPVKEKNIQKFVNDMHNFENVIKVGSSIQQSKRLLLNDMNVVGSPPKKICTSDNEELAIDISDEDSLEDKKTILLASNSVNDSGNIILRSSVEPSMEVHSSLRCEKSLESPTNETCTTEFIKESTVVTTTEPDNNKGLITVNKNEDTVIDINITDQDSPNSTSVVCISDSEDENAQCEGGTSFSEMHKLSEEEVISVLFNKHCHTKLQDGQTQTFVPRQRNVQYTNSKTVCLVKMCDELQIYKIPVYFEVKPKITAKFTYKTIVPPQRTVKNWSNITPVTIRKTHIIPQTSNTASSPCAPKKTIPKLKLGVNTYAHKKVTASIPLDTSKSIIQPIRISETPLVLNPLCSESKSSSKNMNRPIGRPVFKSTKVVGSAMSKPAIVSSQNHNMPSAQSKNAKQMTVGYNLNMGMPSVQANNAPTVLLRIPNTSALQKVINTEMNQTQNVVSTIVPSVKYVAVKSTTKLPSLPPQQTILNGQYSLVSNNANPPQHFLQTGSNTQNIVVLNADKVGTLSEVAAQPLSINTSLDNSTVSQSNDKNKNLIRVKPPWQLY